MPDTKLSRRRLPWLSPENLNIRNRFFFLAILPPTLIGVLTATVLLTWRVTDMRENHQAQARLVAAQIQPAALRLILTGDREWLEQNSVSAISYSSIGSVNLFDGGNHEIYHSGGHWPEGKKFIYPVYTPSRMESSSLPAGFIELVISPQATRIELMRIAIASILVTLAGMTLSLVVASRISRSFIIPLLRMTRAIRQYRLGHFDVRLMETSPRELGTLERGLNMMAASLEAGRTMLKSQVEHATQELRTTLNILEQKNAELEIARRKAVEISHIKSIFLANMSHEMRTPLNGLLGFTHLLERTSMTVTQKEYVNTIRTSSGHLLQVLDDLLDFSRIEAGKLVLRLRRFDVNALVEESIALLAPEAYEQKLEFIGVVYQDVPRFLQGDPVRIRQVITNLLSNAIKFTTQGSVVLRVMLDQCIEDRAAITFSVTDSGIGIAPDHKDMIFQAFTQVDASLTRLHGGTGLGLVICQNLVDAMGGRIDFTSTPGEGACFWFTLHLPLMPDPVKTGREGDKPLVGKRIWLWEAHPLAHACMKNRFTAAGAQVTSCESLHQLRDQIAMADGNENAAVIGLSPGSEEQQDIIDQLAKLQQNKTRIMVMVASMDGDTIEHFHSHGLFCLSKAARSEYILAAIQSLWQLSPAEANRDVSLEPTQSTSDFMPLAGLCILVADDNQINRRLLTTQLMGLGARVLEARDGEAALDVCRAHPDMDAVLMDIHMPRISGIEATKILRQEALFGRYVPILAVTANVLPEERQRFLEAGMDDCLYKPVSEEALLKLLFRHCMRVRRKEVLDPGILSLLHHELPTQRTIMLQALETRDKEELYETAHRIHGTGAWCQLEEIRGCARQVELYIKQTNEIDEQAQRLVGYLDKAILHFLRRHFPGDII